MRAVDTNLLVRVIVDDDTRQVAIAEDFLRGGAWVSLVVLVETIWVISSRYDFSSEQIKAVVVNLLALEFVSIQDGEVVETALEHFVRFPKLGFTDCLVVALAHKNGHTPVGTFDKALAKLEGTQKL